MERIIKTSDLVDAVNAAYKKFKGDKDGSVSDLNPDANTKKLAISVILTDGTVIEAGDTDELFALGNLSQIPVASQLLQDNTPEELLKKSGTCPNQANGCCHESHKLLKHLPIKARLLRAISAIEPSGDHDGKMDLIVNNLTAMIGGEPMLDDGIYKQLLQRAADADMENVLAKAEFSLYDDASTTIDIAARLEALRVTTTQLATLGATVLADGVNPVTNAQVFDGAISERIIAMMATFGPARKAHGWLISSGVPVMAGFSGAMLGIVPGVMAIAAYSPALNHKGFSNNAAHAIRYIANTLQVNAFASAKVKFEN